MLPYISYQKAYMNPKSLIYQISFPVKQPNNKVLRSSMQRTNYLKITYFSLIIIIILLENWSKTNSLHVFKQVNEVIVEDNQTTRQPDKIR